LNPAGASLVSQAVISRNGIRAVLAGLLALALLPASASAAPTVAASRILVPGIQPGSKIVEGPDHNMWVTVEHEEMDVARIAPSGTVTEFKLEAAGNALEGASGIATDAEGHLWVTGEGKVAKFSPSANPEGTAVVEDLAQVKGAENGGASLVLGPDGRMWAATVGTVVAFKPTDTNLEVNHTEFQIAGLTPHDIDVAGQLLVIADQTKVLTLTRTGTEKAYALVGASQGVAGTKSGLFAYSEPGNPQQHVGLISPPNPVASIETPGGIGDPFGVTVGSDDAFWFVFGGENIDRLGRLTPSGQLSFLNGLPAKSQGKQIASGPSNTLWVTLTKPENQEGVIEVTGLEPQGAGGKPNPPPRPPHLLVPQTKLAKTSPAYIAFRRAKVKFRFSSPNPGSSFECRLRRLGRRPRTPAFAPCKSPVAYRLRSGHYRFEVRAVLGGVVDPSPAKRSFEVFELRSVLRFRHG
jgi:streptogramin lyase